MLKRIGLLVLSFGLAQCVCSQDLSLSYNPINYQVIDGLPSAETYFVFNDSKGYIWVGTDKGVARYDGYEFTTYTTKDGLTDNTVFHIFEDHRGRIWFGTYSLKLCYFENGKIHPYKYNDVIFKNQKNGLIYNLFIDKVDNISFTLQGRPGYVRISNNGNFYKYHKPVLFNKDIGIIRFNANSLERIACFNSKVCEQLQQFQNNKQLSGHLNTLVKNAEFFYGNSQLIINDFYTKEEHISYAINGTYKEHEKSNNYTIRWSILNQGTRHWVATNTGIVMLDANFSTTAERHLKGKYISDITQDQQGGIWASTNQSGIYYFPNTHVKSAYLKEDLYEESVHSVFRLQDKVMLLDNSGSVFQSKLEGFKNIGTSLEKKNAYRIDDVANLYFKEKLNLFAPKLNDFITELKTDTWRSYSPFFLTLDNSKHYASTYIQGDTIKNFIPVNQYKKFDATTSWVSTGRRILKKENSSYKNILSDSINNKLIFKIPYVTSIYPETKNEILIGTIRGLWQYNDSTKKERYLGDSIPSLSYRIQDMSKLNNKLLIGTRGNGLIIKEKDTVYQISKDNGLLSNTVNQILIDENNVVWIATSGGINKLTIENTNVSITDKIDITDGLNSPDIRSLYTDKNVIYAGTDRGLNVIDKSIFKRNRPRNRLFFDKVTINNAARPVKNSYELKPKENNLKISFKQISFKPHEEPIYWYRMKGVNDTWTSTLNTAVTYDALPSGNYEFELALEPNSSPQAISSLKIVINKSFWKKWWFLVSVGIFIMGLTFLFFRYLLKRKQAVFMQQKQMSDLRATAMSNQMNSHFMSNSLNAIQNFILHNDSISASRYLAKFSNLIRNTMHASQENWINLEEEKRTLVNYLELEKLRFKNKFDFKITLHEIQNPDDILIPTILIQPFVENAIWHGINRLTNREGQVTIDIHNKNQHFLEVVIEDNGVGRNNNKKKTHISFSTNVSQERMALYDISEVKSTNYIRYEDLVDNRNQPIGTKVIILVPFKLKEYNENHSN